ncbi:hypothetical protein [Catenuloplanes sp. NPDC020197]|uniref:Uncharacterized protein n=1 Tax=Catenuloplanes niger TaxID=587534 RepID=A0AAE4A0E6_9ACTN|nr:hypothetical protein [Catenuloplanes niger]
MHRSILVRLLATSTLVAVCAVTGTAWPAVKTTTQAIARQQGRSLADDKAVHEELRGFAATHRSWDEVGPLLRQLGTRTGHRVALYTADRRLIAESAPAPLTTDTPASIVDR